MPRGVPRAGFRMTKNRKAGQVNGFTMPDAPKPVKVIVETVEQTEEKLNDRFCALETMSEATVKGVNRALIVSGPAGLGKSYGVEAVVEKLTRNGRFKAEIVSGFVRPTGMYRLLYENRFSHCVIVFDDADSIFSDDISLNLLKKACDSTDKRTVSWLAETKMEDDEGEKLPRSFEFNGSVIFITNLDFDLLIERGHKLAPHLEAIISRSHYLDLAMKTCQDYIVRIKQVLALGMLQKKGFSKDEERQVVEFIETNQERLRELSLRMVLKIANTIRMSPNNWRKLATQTCMRQQ